MTGFVTITVSGDMNRSLLTLLSALALVLAACASDTASPPADETDSPAGTATDAPTDDSPEATDAPADGEASVRISSSVFSPSILTVAPGTTVVFTNADSLAHTVTHGTNGVAEDDAMVDEVIDRGGTVSVTFEEPGTYRITCRFHPDMNMIIRVEG